MPSGGKREGAGRRKGSVSRLTALKEKAKVSYEAVLLTKVIENKENLANAAIAKALTGDATMFRELHERTMGKVADKLQVEGKLLVLDDEDED